ncbi:hypothetical protein MSP8886_02981 [Marinomonas spartinae]|uniref:DUF6795 domain-containing protein n=1 Tax=Marinomonas spartinae TaxID=1792290 RepID=A0A1A8TJZ8_9GAMM|nr:DUF6795 domain-containing protein [Marinomonas spartinae]SBS34157.1 hypothetical protein MSP8886_02981 [Marinomonas spartinae]
MFGLIRYKVHLCCEVKGRLTVGGKPLINQLVERSLTYDEEEVDSVYTDDGGYFTMPAKSLKSRQPGSIFHQPVVRVIIITRYEGVMHTLWFSNQRGINIPNEYKKRMSSLNGDLSLESIDHDFTDPNDKLEKYSVESICRWENI